MQSISASMRRFSAAAGIHHAERKSAAMLSLLLYVLGGISLAADAFLPGVPDGHQPVILAISAVAVALGVSSYFALAGRAPTWLLHIFQAAALATVAAVVAATGGASSPSWFYIIIPALYTAYFYGRSVAATYLGLCVVVQALPLLYDGRAWHDQFLAELITAAPAYVALGFAISTGKRRILALRVRAEMLAAEQGTMRRVATAVLGGEPAEGIYEMVAHELAALLRCSGAGILRHEDDDSLLVVGAFGEHPGQIYEPGTVVPVRPGSDARRALDLGVPVRVDHHEDDAPVMRIGYRATIVAPVRAGQRIWGLLAVASCESGAFTAEDEQTLLEFGDLLVTAIASAEERQRLAEQALSDALTGLANQRAFQGRLAAEMARAQRREAPLAVAMIDIDHFKEINDTAGHETGDEMLVRVARALGSFARAEDTLGRVGGDEFAWLLPDTTREQALVAVERARRLIAAAPADPYRITISAGICDTEAAAEPAELIRCADSALYWSKAHGRNQSWIYDAAVVDDLTEQQRAERLERTQALEGLCALVRAREDADPATRQHSERVATLSAKLADRAGWSRQRAIALSQAALLHDAARITGAGGEAPGAAGLDEPAVARLRTAAELSARIVEDVLTPEQIGWIRGQYELRGEVSTLLEEAGDGASLLAVADAWDTLTAVVPGLPEQALARLRDLAGVRFTHLSVELLEALSRAGELGTLAG